MPEVQETAKVPLCFPLVVGANLIVPALLWPGAKVRGKVQPLAENALPVMFNWVIVSFAFPEFFRVSVRDCELPRETVSPKPIFQGLGVSWPEDCASARVENEVSRNADKSMKEIELHREELLLTVRPL